MDRLARDHRLCRRRCCSSPGAFLPVAGGGFSRNLGFHARASTRDGSGPAECCASRPRSPSSKSARVRGNCGRGGRVGDGSPKGCRGNGNQDDGDGKHVRRTSALRGIASASSKPNRRSLLSGGSMEPLPLWQAATYCSGCSNPSLVISSACVRRSTFRPGICRRSC